MHQCYYGNGNNKINACYDVLRSIVIGWLFDEKDISHAIHTFCLCDDKEELYASHFLAKLIFKLRHGKTKKDAAQVKFAGTFRSFTKEEHWKNGDGVLGYLVRAWMSFYDAYDFGSTIHNAVKKTGDVELTCILAGALADAMYGCDNYYVKKQFQGGCYLNKLPYIDDRVYKINKKNRIFFAKNNAMTNVDKHCWHDSKCPFENKVIDEELHRRIFVAFQTGWDDRYGFYLDNGWIYVYRSYIILARFTLTQQNDGTNLRGVILLDKEVLLVYDTVVRQDLDRLGPCRVYRLILRLCDGEEFGKLHTIADRDVGILADDAVVLNRQNRELAFEGSCFHYISHDFLFLRLALNNRKNRLRLMM